MSAALQTDRDELAFVRDWSDALMGRLRSELNRAALAYWLELLSPAGLPRKSEIDPADMTAFLRQIILLDVKVDPLDFRYRLIGGTARGLLETDLTGQWMADIPHNAAPSNIHNALAEVVRTGLPASTDIPYVGPRAAYVTLEDVVMPLVDDRGRISHLLVTVDQFSLVDGALPDHADY